MINNKIKKTFWSLLLVLGIVIFANLNNVNAAGTEDSPDGVINCYINSECDFSITGLKDNGSDYGTGLRSLEYSTKNLDWYTINVVNNLDDPNNIDGETKAQLSDGTQIYETIDIYLTGKAPIAGQLGFLYLDVVNGAGTVNRLVYRVNTIYRYQFKFNVNGGINNSFTTANWMVEGSISGNNVVYPKPTINGTWGANYIEPVRTGFTFNGWYRDEATMTPYAWGSEVKKDTTVFAGWKKAYTLQYNGNGCDYCSEPPSETVYKNEKAVTDIAVAYPDNILEKIGYSFDGWNTRKDGKGITYRPGSAYPLKDNTVLYAKWVKQSEQVYYKDCIQYDYNGFEKFFSNDGLDLSCDVWYTEPYAKQQVV